ncbi:related to oxidoreductase [Phialocephala subalpina]|uniref:Related to oxidoreductase n=1 Tax=Phialocephala subalpina TaxID=576137 RepID=A0A1L7WDC0_9HELO|nr:related to oxidoreductase [Phialocephala subalpina]
MRALALSHHCNPSEYNVATLEVPKITQPDELLIRVHAAAVNPIDVKLASGLGKLLGGAKFPYKMGYDLAGTVAAVGSGVSQFKPGDEVYSRINEKYRGSIAEYALSSVFETALKPSTLSFIEAAAIPLAGLTALQALDIGQNTLEGGLEGKTVFITAGLGGTGSFALQLAKQVFGAKTITTLSTGKIPMIKASMGERGPDIIVDYTKEKTVQSIGKKNVDFMFDTARQTVSALGVMKKGGMIVSISTVPNGTNFKKKNKQMPAWLVVMMNIFDWCLRTWTSIWGVNYKYLVMEGNARDLERMRGWVDEGKVRPVVGQRAKLSDIEGMRNGCQQILDGKGGVGKFVIEID